MKDICLRAAVVLGMTLGVAFPGTTHAVGCGDVLSGPGVFVLDQDLACGTGPALVVQDGATLDLRGHTVSCTNLDNGISVAGVGARLRNGTVTGCNDGVSLSGSGHLVKRVTSRQNVRGFLAEEGLSGSRLLDDVADFNGAGGFLIFGDDNVLKGNQAAGNGDVPMLVVGTGNTVTRNATNGNCIGTTCSAAYFIGGDDNEVTRNTATAELVGFRVTPSLGSASGNTLARNKALFTTLAGILVEGGATGNTLVRNTASSLGGTNLADLNPDCDANAWKKNTFATSNQPCID